MHAVFPLTRGGVRTSRWLLAGLCLCSAMVPGSRAAEPAAVPAATLALQLEAKDRDLQREAARQLEKLGPAALPALPSLVKAVNDFDKQVVTGSLAAIGSMGPAATPAIGALLETLENKRPGREADRQQITLRTAEALAKLGPGAVLPLTEALAAENLQRRLGATLALGLLGPVAVEAAPVLARNLGAYDEPLRRATIESMSNLGVGAVKTLVASLQEGQPKSRVAAAMALGQMGRPAAEAGAALLAVAEKESDVGVRAAALAALGTVGPESDEAAKVLLEAANSEVVELRHAAVNALLVSPKLSARAMPALRAELQSPESKRRRQAALILGRFGSRAQEAVPPLLQLARDERGETVYATALAQIGTAALGPLLQELANTQTPEPEKVWIFRALGEMGAPALNALGKALRSPAPEVRAGAANALAGMSLERSPLLQLLLELTNDPQPSVRAAALRALASVRSLAATVVPKLETGMDDADAGVRKASAFGLASLGAVGKIGVAGLLKMAQDPDPATQRVAVRGLGVAGAEAEKAVPLLLELVRGTDLRTEAVEALAAIGPAGVSAMPTLIEIAKGVEEVDRVPLFTTMCAIGREGEAALPLFYEGTHSAVRELRPLAMRGLVKFERDESKLLPVLVAAQRSDQRRTRREAQVGLKIFGPRADAAVPALVALLDGEQDRADALDTLQAIHPRSLPTLLALLKHKEASVRAFACDSLGALGADGQEAVPALSECAARDEDRVKQAARHALEKIGGSKPAHCP